MRKPSIRKIKETCLYVKDLSRTAGFYNGIMGLPVISMREGNHVFFRAGDDVLLCFIAEATRQQTGLPQHYASGDQHFAFECSREDYGTWKELLLKSGVQIEHEEDWGNDILSVYFRDPDGNSVEIVMPGLWD